VRLLVAAGADVNDAAPMGTSTLVVAALSGQGAVATFLLEQGADPDAADAGYTALHAAVLRGDLELVTALLAHGADPSPQLIRGTPARRVSADWRLGHNMIGATPFWLAARFREPAIMRVLAEGGADPLASKGGATAVMAALQGGTTRGRFGIPRADRTEEGRLTIAAVEQALEAGADVDGTNDGGDTAMHIAASRGLDDVIALLAARGATLDVRNERGQTPLGVAIGGPQGVAALYNPGGGRPSTVALLRELGATDEGTPR
jgi:ankyrin repeat protein